jgi:xanthine dehydrogenase accessory protein XdhC
MPLTVLRRAFELVVGGESVALATVVRVSGSVPRHPGAMMAVTQGGAVLGTVGGGRIELLATTAAAAVAAGAPARRLTRHLVRDLAMCCGGAMELYIEPMAPSRDALAQALAAAAERVPCWLATPLDGSGKRVERWQPDSARLPALRGDTFWQPVLPPARLVLFGAGHVARAVAPLAAGVGFEVVVCDDGETGATEQAVPGVAVRVDSFAVSDVEGRLGPLGVGDYVVILTRDHAIDQRVLEQLLGRATFSYLGLIGSLGKVGRFRKRLEAKGVATPERWATLHAPVGLDIGAETPDEIAVAIVGELIRVRNRGEGPAR